MRRAGFTLTEIIVVMGILGVLASLLFPAIVQARIKARGAQCTNNLRQLGQALMMYDTDHERTLENYPDRLTHLYEYLYVRDKRIFLCPMDSSHGTTTYGRTALKPIYSLGTPKIPADDKADWAERASFPADLVAWPAGGQPVYRKEQNCSYLYEFSTRKCESWSRDGAGRMCWNGGWASDVLVGWYASDYGAFNPDDLGYAYTEAWDVVNYAADDDYVIVAPANPANVDRDGNGIVTWQEAKFCQLENGDAFVSGIRSPGSSGSLPANWSTEPYDTINPDGGGFWGDNSPQRSYPRTWMPIVRCFYHQTPALMDQEGFEEVLNLAVDGNTFYSSPGWENTAWKSGRNIDYDLLMVGQH